MGNWINKKKLVQPTFYLLCVLSIISMIAIYASFIEAYQTSKLECCSKENLVMFLSYFQPFYPLFGATIIVMTLDLAISRLRLLGEGNLLAHKSSQTQHWMDRMKRAILVVEEKNYLMSITINSLLPPINNYLFEIDYSFLNKTKLLEFMNKFVVDQIKNFELGDFECNNIGYYPSEFYSYSFGSFKNLMILMTDTHKSYPKMLLDMEAIYKDNVNTYIKSEELIDSKAFMLSIERFRKEQAISKESNNEKVKKD